MNENSIVLKSDFVLNNLYLITKKVTSNQKLQYLIIILIFLLLYPLGLYMGAKYSDVWDGIDYSLKNSYTTYIGDCFIGFINALIISYYLYIPKTYSIAEKKGVLEKKDGLYSLIDTIFNAKKNYQAIFIMVSVFITIGIHFIWWLSDDLQGWTESEPGKPNILGFYHMFLFATQAYILITFVWNLNRTSTLIKETKKLTQNGSINFIYDRFCVWKCGGFIILPFICTKGVVC